MKTLAAFAFAATVAVLGSAAPAAAQFANPGLTGGLQPNLGVNQNVKDRLCQIRPSRACAEDKRQSPGPRSAGDRRPTQQGGGPRPQRRR